MATESIVTAPFRLAFPEVFEPKVGQDGGKPKYSINILLPKNGNLIPSIPGDGITPLRKLALEAIEQAYGKDKAKWPANLKAIDPKTHLSITGKDGWPFRDGDTVEWDGYAGHVFVRASSQFRPGIVNAKLQPIMSQEDVFGGLICRAQINAYCYDTNGSKGVTFGLNNLQILKDDGTVFGGGAQRAEEAFKGFEFNDDGSVMTTGDEPW